MDTDLPEAGMDLLSGVSAFVVRWRADGDISFHAPLIAKLAQLGARTHSRLGKDVTHVIFHKKAQPSLQERAAEEEKLRDLYDKAVKEQEFLVEQPQEQLWFHCPGPSDEATKRRAARRKSVSAMRPRDTLLAVDVHADMFSSSQQMRGEPPPAGITGTARPTSKVTAGAKPGGSVTPLPLAGAVASRRSSRTPGGPAAAQSTAPVDRGASLVSQQQQEQRLTDEKRLLPGTAVKVAATPQLRPKSAPPKCTVGRCSTDGSDQGNRGMAASPEGPAPPSSLTKPGLTGRSMTRGDAAKSMQLGEGIRAQVHAAGPHPVGEGFAFADISNKQLVDAGGERKHAKRKTLVWADDLTPPVSPRLRQRQGASAANTPPCLKASVLTTPSGADALSLLSGKPAGGGGTSHRPSPGKGGCSDLTACRSGAPDTASVLQRAAMQVVSAAAAAAAAAQRKRQSSGSVAGPRSASVTPSFRRSRGEKSGPMTWALWDLGVPVEATASLALPGRLSVCATAPLTIPKLRVTTSSNATPLNSNAATPTSELPLSLASTPNLLLASAATPGLGPSLAQTPVLASWAVEQSKGDTPTLLAGPAAPGSASTPTLLAPMDTKGCPGSMRKAASTLRNLPASTMSSPVLSPAGPVAPQPVWQLAPCSSPELHEECGAQLDLPTTRLTRSALKQPKSPFTSHASLLPRHPDSSPQQLAATPTRVTRSTAAKQLAESSAAERISPLQQQQQTVLAPAMTGWHLGNGALVGAAHMEPNSSAAGLARSARKDSTAMAATLPDVELVGQTQTPPIETTPRRIRRARPCPLSLTAASASPGLSQPAAMCTTSEGLQQQALLPGQTCQALGSHHCAGPTSPRSPLLQQEGEGGTPQQHVSRPDPFPSTPVGSVLHTSQLPDASIVGTPLTTPSHYTRLQRHRYGRLGIDLEPLPRGEEIVVHPDGTITITSSFKHTWGEGDPMDEEHADQGRGLGEATSQPDCTGWAEGRGGCQGLLPSRLASPAWAAAEGCEADLAPAGDEGSGDSQGAGASPQQRCTSSAGRPASEQLLGSGQGQPEELLAQRHEPQQQTAEERSAVKVAGAVSGGQLPREAPADALAKQSLVIPPNSSCDKQLHQAAEALTQPLLAIGQGRKRQLPSSPILDKPAEANSPASKRCRVKARQVSPGPQPSAAAAVSHEPHLRSPARQATPRTAAGPTPQASAAPIAGVAAALTPRMICPSGPPLWGGRSTAATTPLRNGNAAGTAPQVGCAVPSLLKAGSTTAAGSATPGRKQGGLLPGPAPPPAQSAGPPACATAGNRIRQFKQTIIAPLLRRGAPAPGPSLAAQQLPGATWDRGLQQKSRDGGDQARRKYLAYTSVDVPFIPIIQGAVKSLPSAKMCVEGYEGGRVTHLIMGAERRTLKVLISIANGAHLVRPEWVSASLAAGEWLPEDGFRTATRFAEVADRARAQLALDPPPARPLEGILVAVHCMAGQGAASAKASEHRKGLERLVVALGGRVVPARACNLCVVGGGVKAPRGLPVGCQAVAEQWLLVLAETHKSPDTRLFPV